LARDLLPNFPFTGVLSAVQGGEPEQREPEGFRVIAQEFLEACGFSGVGPVLEGLALLVGEGYFAEGE